MTKEEKIALLNDIYDSIEQIDDAALNVIRKEKVECCTAEYYQYQTFSGMLRDILFKVYKLEDAINKESD